ncbi:MAG: aldehyde dehydrogenase family protein [Phycisphaerae bacterium]|jgi:acyl-CoA reductase-like NAD-dependent aldehyde dehydrogenase|nr:aldehyde dehydrogenase family protein [Phycisphaerae bacterium]
MSRLTVPKTYKLYIGGKFPRTESGRSIAIENQKSEIVAHICHGSRKDFRNAVESAHKAFDSWSGITGYLRGQILYRMAEMLEGRKEEFAAAIQVTQPVTNAVARKEVDASVDRLVTFAGWTDKYQQVIGCANPVAGSYYNFTIPQPQGVVVAIAPQSPSLLGLITCIGAPICSGNTVVALGSEVHPITTAIFGEVCQTSDVPAGVINLLTGKNKELLEHIATHRQVAGLYVANPTKKNRTLLEEGSADSMKRVHCVAFDESDWYDNAVTASPWEIEPFVEMKTIWHPSAC